MTTPFRINAIALAACILAASHTAHATNGMNMEGYGPIATGMGGAATAYDNGTAGMANNPATLQLAPNGHRVDGAIGILGPSITAEAQTGAPAQSSSATSFVMPAVGWTKTNDKMTWGMGVFAQGGMGAEYAGSSYLSAMTADSVRSELGVGRVIFPVAYRVNSQLTLGASLDFVWAGLDMKMAASGAQFVQMMSASGKYTEQQAIGAVTTPAQQGGFGMTNDNTTVARLDFSDSSAFTGAAKGTGLGAKIGATIDLSPSVRVGFSYHGKTNLSDMKTGASSTNLTMSNGMVVPGQITVIDFQWPASTSIGASWQATPKLMVAADVTNIGWKDVMEKFNMKWQAAAGGDPAYFSMTQNWKNQTVAKIGASYQMDDSTTVRAGVNLASNPVPAETTHPLFPATVKNHYTFGFGHQIDRASSIDVSATVAPKVSVTNGYGGVITHSQTNFQLMYSYRY